MLYKSSGCSIQLPTVVADNKREEGLYSDTTRKFYIRTTTDTKFFIWNVKMFCFGKTHIWLLNRQGIRHTKNRQGKSLKDFWKNYSLQSSKDTKTTSKDNKKPLKTRSEKICFTKNTLQLRSEATSLQSSL